MYCWRRRLQSEGTGRHLSASLWAGRFACRLPSSLHLLSFRGQWVQSHNYLSSTINETYLKWGLSQKINSKCALIEFISRLEILSQRLRFYRKNHDNISKLTILSKFKKDDNWFGLCSMFHGLGDFVVEHMLFGDYSCPFQAHKE